MAGVSLRHVETMGGTMTTAVSCKLCYGNGYRSSGAVCEGCGGAGSVHILEPVTSCKLCYGNGYRSSGAVCEGCGGCGYAGRVSGAASVSVVSGSTSYGDGNAALIGEIQATRSLVLDELQAIRKATANAAQQIAEMGSIAYFVGVFVSMGMNFAIGNGLGALLLCWLSWLNVGYVVVGLATGTYATPHPAG